MSENLPAVIDGDLKMATILLKGGLLPAHYKTPEAVVTAIWYGRELQMSPIRAIQSLNVIQGKPTLDAQALKAIAIAHGGQFRTIEWTADKCTIEGKRGDWVETNTFSMGDATLQGLAGKDNWKRMPKAMLYARCVSVLIRNMFADVIGGLYGREEMEDAINITPVARVEEPKQLPPSVKVADELPPPSNGKHLFHYMINEESVGADKLPAAMQILQRAGAEALNEFGLFASKRRIPKFDSYEVKDDEEAYAQEEASA